MKSQLPVSNRFREEWVVCQEKFATMLKKDPLHLLFNLQVSMEVKQFRLEIKHLRRDVHPAGEQGVVMSG